VLHWKNGLYIGKNLIFSLNRQLFSMVWKNNEAGGEAFPLCKRGLGGFLSRTRYAIPSAAFSQMLQLFRHFGMDAEIQRPWMAK